LLEKKTVGSTPADLSGTPLPGPSAYRPGLRRFAGARGSASRIFRRFRNRCFLDLAGDHRGNLLIVGSGRSGTTWLAELVNAGNDYRVIFEPFSWRHVSQSSAFHSRQYLRPGESSQVHLDTARIILNGNLSTPWVDSRNHRYVCRGRLIKEIRANLFLSWLLVNFPGMRVVFLIRHPCAYALSRVRQGFDVDGMLHDMLAQPALVADFLEPHLGFMKSLNSPFEKHVFQWCVEQAVPLATVPSDEFFPLFYEELCATPERSFQGLLTHIGRASKEFQTLDFGRPSSTTRPWSAVGHGQDPASAWVSEVSSASVKRAMEILSRFTLDGLYDEGPRPHREILQELQGRGQETIPRR